MQQQDGRCGGGAGLAVEDVDSIDRNGAIGSHVGSLSVGAVRRPAVRHVQGTFTTLTSSRITPKPNVEAASTMPRRNTRLISLASATAFDDCVIACVVNSFPS